MKPSSAKAKGRNFQNKVRKLILEHLPIDERDIKTAVMGESGMDIKLSSKAQEIFPFAVECKKVEKISIWKCYEQACENADDLTPLLIFSKNNSKILICFEFNILLNYMYKIRFLNKLVNSKYKK